MANLKINSEFGNAEVKVDPIHGDARKVNSKEIVMKPDGSPRMVYKDPTKTSVLLYMEIDASTGQAIRGRTSKYVDINGKEYTKEEVVAFFEDMDGNHIEAEKNVKTDIFEVKKWEPVCHYTDKYQMDRYYQVRPSPGVSTRDHTKKLSVEVNTVELKKLWNHMWTNQVVGRGALNMTSSGYLPSYAYLRAIKPTPDTWSFEIAVFKENKPVTWSEKDDWQPSMLNKNTTVQVPGRTDVAHIEEI